MKHLHCNAVKGNPSCVSSEYAARQDKHTLKSLHITQSCLLSHMNVLLKHVELSFTDFYFHVSLLKYYILFKHI